MEGTSVSAEIMRTDANSLTSGNDLEAGCTAVCCRICWSWRVLSSKGRSGAHFAEFLQTESKLGGKWLCTVPMDMQSLLRLPIPWQSVPKARVHADYRTVIPIPET